MSTMKLVRPAPVTAATLTSNIAETGSEWSAAATYAKGATAIATAEDGLKHGYESLVEGNVGNALSDVAKWLDLGATNRWAMFDDVNGTLTEGAAGIDATIAVTGRADAVALLNVAAEAARVTMTVAGSTVYDQTFSLVSTENITDWFAYFTEEIVYKEDLVLTGLPLFMNPAVRMRLSSNAGPVAVGKAIVGQTRDLGLSLIGASIGIQDFSKKTEDEFGNLVLTRRAYKKQGNFKLMTEANVSDGVARTLASYRATPLLWLGTEEFASTWIFGWYRDWSIEFAFHGAHYTNLQIEGII